MWLQAGQQTLLPKSPQAQLLARKSGEVNREEIDCFLLLNIRWQMPVKHYHPGNIREIGSTLVKEEIWHLRQRDGRQSCARQQPFSDLAPIHCTGLEQLDNGLQIGNHSAN